MTIGVLIADDEQLVRAGLRLVLRAESDIDVVGEAADGLVALTETRRLHPEIVLMDIQMPRLDGIAATRRILAEVDPPPKVLMLTTFGLDQHVYDAFRAGASGFLLKDSPPEELVSALRVVAEGNALLGPAVTRRVIEEFLHRPTARPELAAHLQQLTIRERDVLGLVGRGLSNAEIATDLSIGEATVRTHLTRLLQKLDLRDRVHAVVFAYESGLVQVGDGTSRPNGG